MSWQHDVWLEKDIAASPSYSGVRLAQGWAGLTTLSKDNMGNVKSFTVNVVWKALRPRDVKVQWVDVVWFANSANCPLCESTADSHAHIFFECPFSWQIWNSVKDWARLSGLPPSINLIISDITLGAHRRTTKCVIAKLVVTAAAYFLWQERNARLLKKN
ncbi:hypothetical protein Tco_0347336 [Tanacetum coccineum]